MKASSGVLSAGLALPFALPTFARAAWWCSGLSLGPDGRECLLVLSLIVGALLVFAAVLLRAQERR